jgi:hypothetical protein
MSDFPTWYKIDSAFNRAMEVDAEATDAIGSFISDVSDAFKEIGSVAGPVGTVISVVSSIISATQPNPLQDAVNKISQAIDQELLPLLKQIKKDLNVKDVRDRNTNIEHALSTAANRFGNLTAYVKESNLDVDQILSDCTLAFTELSGLVQPDSLWSINYDWWLWWSDEKLYENSCYFVAGPDQVSGSYDAGYGPQTVPNKDGTVFAYSHSLAAYLSAVAYLLAVGGALKPQFPTLYSERLKEIANDLSTKHDTAMSGIVSLLPANWTDPGSGLWINACQGRNPASRTNAGIRLIYATPIDLSKSLPNVVGAIIEYGAVERFSGCSSIGDAYQISTTSALDNYGQDPKIFNKLRLRCFRRIRDVYSATGLRTAWQVVKQLNQLAGGAPPAQPTFIWPDESRSELLRWSFRQVLGLAKLPATAKGYSLRALASLIIQTQPFDTPYTNAPAGTEISFKQLLQNLSD